MYEGGTKSEAMGGEDSGGDGDQVSQLLNIYVSKGTRSPGKDDDPTFQGIISLRSIRNSPAVNDEKSIAQNMVAMNSVNVNNKIFSSQLLRVPDDQFWELQQDKLTILNPTESAPLRWKHSWLK